MQRGNDARALFLGIDGGGTKTAFVLGDRQGRILGQTRTQGISCRQYPLAEILRTLREGVQDCLRQAGGKEGELAAVCIGCPCYGESSTTDRALDAAAASLFGPACLMLVNDVEVGWAGALEGRPGIHVVAGTGAIAFARNGAGESARCGGWDEHFSDEGSCYWLGLEAMRLFCREADGRTPRGPLYDLVRGRFGLGADFEFVDHVLREILPQRDKVAGFQLVLREAARQGDVAARGLYAFAAAQLAELVAALKDRLQMETGFSTSYSGSLFKEKELVLDTFSQRVRALGGKVVPPAASPELGALKMAIASLGRRS